MQTLYYIAMLVGVTWLCIWVVLPEHLRRRYWSPFDMQDAGTSAEPGLPTSRPAGWRARSAQPRRGPTGRGR